MAFGKVVGRGADRCMCMRMGRQIGRCVGWQAFERHVGRRIGGGVYVGWSRDGFVVGLGGWHAGGVGINGRFNFIDNVRSGRIFLVVGM